MQKKMNKSISRYHIVLDGWCRSKIGNRLSVGEYLSGVIRVISEICEMRILHGPVVVSGVPENPGLTAFAIIDFSHISVHTFTNSNQVCVDIFSCKSFNEEALRDYLNDAFHLDNDKSRWGRILYDESIIESLPSSMAQNRGQLSDNIGAGTC